MISPDSRFDAGYAYEKTCRLRHTCCTVGESSQPESVYMYRQTDQSKHVVDVLRALNAMASPGQGDLSSVRMEQYERA